MKKEKIIVYGLGQNFKNNIEYLKENFEVVGYSDRDETKWQILEKSEEFINIKDIVNFEFDKVVICGGGYQAKNNLNYWLMDKIKREDIVLVEELKRRKIDKEQLLRDMEKYSQSNKREIFQIKDEKIFTCLTDISEDAGKLDSHYFMQDICVAKKILQANPQEHYDVGSRVEGFLSHLLVFRENITMIDVRPMNIKIDGLKFICSDATYMNGIEDESIESLSSLHALEHFGLGRYGDPVDAEACFKALKSFARVLKKNGTLYLSVPCGQTNEVYFNAHRVFHPMTIVNEVRELALIEFEAISNFQVKKVDITNAEELSKLGDDYCGIFTFKKL